MTLVTDILTQARIDELRAMRAALPESQDIPGKWFPIYDKLYQFITIPGLGGLADAPVAGVDHNVWLWLRGARLVNLGEGPLADLIREYTEIQFHLRYGGTMTQTQLDRASNEIAKGFINEWIPEDSTLQATAVVPGINVTGLNDAAPSAAEVFNGDRVAGDFAPWAGTFLFANLGAPQFYRDWVLKALDNPNTPADPARTIETGSYDIISIAQGVQDYVGAITGLVSTYFFDIFGTGLNLHSYTSIVAQVAGEADAKFKVAYGLGANEPNVKIGSDTFGFFNALTNFWELR